MTGLQLPITNSRTNYIRLVDAYQRLGKAEYADWIDHEICLQRNNKWQITNLAPYVQSANRQSPEPQLYAINLATDTQLAYIEAPFEKVQRHTRLLGLLCKLINDSAVRIDITDSDGKSAELPPEIWHDETEKVEISVIESRIMIRSTAGTASNYRILVEPESLAFWTNKSSMQLQEAKKKERRIAADDKRGRKPEYDWEYINQLATVITEKCPELSKLKRAKMLEEMMRSQGRPRIPDIDSLRKIFTD